MTTPLYIDVHVLQTVPPSNLNRDDAGTPKQAIYGGTRRARVSSQAWKRATRTAFADQVPPQELATRTKRIAAMVSQRLAERSGLDHEKCDRLANALLAGLGIKPGKKAEETAYLLFFGRPQLERLVDLVAGRAVALVELDDKALATRMGDFDVRAALAQGHPIDVALFGRMVADIPGLNVDAAVQVAHALSTHTVDVEFDYYTAVDDENTREQTGAGMIGTVEFNSATLYRFATVGLHQLIENLGGDIEATLTALEVFLTAFVRSMPTGHQNSFAHRTMPNLVSLVIRSDQPVNLVSAFEAPVGGADGFVSASAALLVREMDRAGSLWGLRPAHIASSYAAPERDAAAWAAVLGDSQPFEDAVTAVVEAARQQVASGDGR